MPLATMLRVYFLQNWYALSDPAAEGSSVKQSIQWIDCRAERCMTARRCAALPGPGWAVTAFPTRPPSSTSELLPVSWTPRYELHELNLSLDKALKLLDLAALGSLGVTPEAFGRLSYEERAAEYPRTQDIAEVAHFLEFDGLLVPSARRDCLNAIVFCDRCPPSQREVLASQGVIDWTAWEKSCKGSLS